MTTDDSRINAIRQQIHASYDELQRLLNSPTLDSASLYRPPEADEWTLMENLAHIVEFMPHWADEIAKLVADPGRNFGRTAQDEGRLRAISEHRSDTLTQVKAALPVSYAHLDQVLSSLHDSDLAVVGQHSRTGEHTVEWFIDELITSHLADHIEQIRTCL